jgi:transposase InsO family protein
MHTLTSLFSSNGVPEHIRSDNGPEFTAKANRDWLPRVGVRTLFIQPGSPWENGYNESFNGKLREVEILTERWRQEYNTIRPHSSLGYRPPAPETIRLNRPSDQHNEWYRLWGQVSSTASISAFRSSSSIA